jgi:hypothetical protein
VATAIEEEIGAAEAAQTTHTIKTTNNEQFSYHSTKSYGYPKDHK